MRGVKVTAGASSATTDDRGFAEIDAPAGTTVEASAGGFQSATERIAAS